MFHILITEIIVIVYTNHRRNISDSSFASSFLQSNSGTVIGSPALNSNSISNFNQDLSIGMSPDDSNLSIGFNNISEKTVSPLGQNSIYELVYSSDKNRKTSTGLLTAQSGNAVISLRGPTTRDIPPIQLSKIMKVKSSQFKPYLTSINDEFKKFQLNNNLTASTLEAFMNELSEEERKTKQIKQNHLKNSENISQETLDDDDDDVVVDDNDNDQNIFDDVGGEYDKNSLDTIPQIYFEKDFRLDDPHVFEEVTEHSRILVDGSTEFNDQGIIKPLTDNNLLQEKLSSYLDLVEIHLIHEISKSSNSFFSAIDDLKKITNKSSNLSKDLQKIDFELDELKKNEAEEALKIAQNIQKRNNVEKLEQGLLQLQMITLTQFSL
ncbi:unnamed protein product [[Candida] boidinii]|nr:unnamed protein product [[Candida] boidinii]